MSFEDGMYLAIAIMAAGSVLLGALVAAAAHFSKARRELGHARR
jgi:hypothetical protein